MASLDVDSLFTNVPIHETIEIYVNLIQGGLFWGCSLMGGRAKSPSFPKIRHTYPTMMKLGTVIPHQKKIQKIYVSRETPLDFH